AKLRDQLKEAAHGKGEAAQILGDGPLAQIAFAATPVTDHRTWLASDRKRGRALMLELLRSGVFLNPMGTKLYLSISHDENTFTNFIHHFEQALIATRRASRNTQHATRDEILSNQ